MYKQMSGTHFLPASLSQEK